MKKIKQKKDPKEEEIIKNFNVEIDAINELSQYNGDNLQKVFELIKKIDNQIFLCYFLEILSYSRCFLYKYLADIFEHSLISNKCPNEFKKYSYFTVYLIKRGLISSENIKENKIFMNNYENSDILFYEKPFKEDSIEYFISLDDVSGFVSFSTFHRIDLSQILITIYGESYYVIEFACKIAAIDIIRYCFLNDIIRDSIVQYAVSSGSEEIIELLISNEYSMDNQAYNAIINHQNYLAKILYENYENNPITLFDCLQCMNLEMFYYFITHSNGFDINEIDFNQNTPLHYAVSFNDIKLASLLLYKGADKSLQNNEGQTPYDNENITDEMKELLDMYDVPLIIDI